MVPLFLLLGVATFATPALLRLRPQMAAFLAVIPAAAGAWLRWRVSQPAPVEAAGWASSLGVRFSVQTDGLAMLFAWLICGIGALVFFYAAAYLERDSRVGRFYSYLTLFFASMLGLVLADNIILLFIFWELTSLSSFLLIGYDHDRAAARDAALQTLLVTGLGGLALLAGLLMLATAGGSYELSELVARRGDLRGHSLFHPALLLIILGAMTKSAQFPFHFWLPSAMEAPTPVSTYLHSATMVKAGVYLLARLSPVGSETPLWTGVAIVGLITMLTGFVMALPQRDAKRMLAYSTVGALGMLTMLIGIGTHAAIYSAMAILLAHAFYKASLFLLAGAFDHATGTRDVYEWRGFWRAMPGPSVAALLAAGSLAGLPPLFGYVAKEQVLGFLWELPAGGAALAAATVAGICSVAVAGMLALRPLAGDPREFHAPSLSLWGPPALLSALGVLGGLFPAWADRWLVGPAARAVTTEAAGSKLALWHGFNVPVLISLGILLGGAALYHRRAYAQEIAASLQRVSRWGPERAYGIVLGSVMALARVGTRFLQSGKLRNYMLIVLLTTSGLAYHAMFARGGVSLHTDWLNLSPHEALLAAVMITAAVAALLFQSRLAAVVALGVVGLGVALLFLLFGAPDLAMTQFVVETLTVILLVLVLYHLPRFARFSSGRARLRDLAVAMSAGSLLTLSLLALQGFQRSDALSAYFAQTSVPEAHGRNIVNVILVDFRALDTLGEITVLAVAAIGVYGLLKLRLKSGGQE